MLRKGSETAVHAAGFGLTVRGLRSSDTSKIFRQSMAAIGFPVAAFYVPAVSSHLMQDFAASLRNIYDNRKKRQPVKQAGFEKKEHHPSGRN